MANNRNTPNPNDLKLDVSSEVANGTYSNLAIISHSPTEIILDFAQMLPGTPNATVRSRVIMNPVHAKRLLAALNDNIQKYERNFGTIVDPQNQAALNADTVPYDILGKA
ncbi:MAG: DUF3467 domain-containing protein [Bacteroidales bacterium]|nr:DUF3467 domain-containing protein [Bacteroidales bacterium]